MIKKRLRVTLHVTNGSALPIYLVPEGEYELTHPSLTALRSAMLERLSRVIKDGGLLAVSRTHFINTTHIVRVVADDEVEEYNS